MINKIEYLRTIAFWDNYNTKLNPKFWRNWLSGIAYYLWERTSLKCGKLRQYIDYCSSYNHSRKISSRSTFLLLTFQAHVISLRCGIASQIFLIIFDDTYGKFARENVDFLPQRYVTFDSTFEKFIVGVKRTLSRKNKEKC